MTSKRTMVAIAAAATLAMGLAACGGGKKSTSNNNATNNSTPGANAAVGKIFNPSDAKGAEGDMDWINTGTVFARASMTNAVVSNRGTAGTRFDPAALLAGKTLATATDVVEALVDRFGLANVSPQTKAVWAKFVDAKSDGSRGFWQNTSSVFDQKVRGVIHLMLTSPDYNLC